MAKLSDLVRTINDTAKAGDRVRALAMLDNLIARVPAEKAGVLRKRRQRLAAELELDRRISALEKQYGA